MNVFISALTSFLVSMFTLIILPYLKNYIERRGAAYDDFYKKICKVDFVAIQAARSKGWDVSGAFKSLNINDAIKEINNINIELIEKRYFFGFFFGKSMIRVLNEHINKIDLAFLKGREDFDNGIANDCDQDDADNLYANTIYRHHRAARATLKKIYIVRKKSLKERIFIDFFND